MDSVHIKTPAGLIREREFALRTLFEDFLGLDCSFSEDPSLSTVLLTCASAGAGELVFDDTMLSCADGKAADASALVDPAVLPAEVQYLSLESISEALGSKPLDAPLPVLFRAGGEPFLRSETNAQGATRLVTNIDVAGTIFFFLSRLEESIVGSRDNHGRFQASDSTLTKFDIVDRAVVDELVELMRAMLQRTFGALTMAPCKGTVRVSCDIDQIRDPGLYDMRNIVRRVGRDVIRDRSPTQAFNSLKTAAGIRVKGSAADPCSTLEWMMDVNERGGHTCQFNFMGSEPNDFDSGYSLQDPVAVTMMASVVERGHLIGFHPGYYTVDDFDQMQTQYQRIEKAAVTAGYKQDAIDARQHYLRWDHSRTPRDYERLGIQFDSSAGYAETPGFRAGTARPYKAWDFDSRSALNIRIQPLVLMEQSLMGYQNLDLASSETLDSMLAVRDRTLRYGGDFGLLWHNTTLSTKKERGLYEALLCS